MSSADSPAGLSRGRLALGQRDRSAPCRSLLRCDIQPGRPQTCRPVVQADVEQGTLVGEANSLFLNILTSTD